MGISRRPSAYVPPRDLVLDLLLAASSEVRAVMFDELEVVKKQLPTGTWPYEPYHPGMGTIPGYDTWLARLSENDRQLEIENSRVRFELHHGERGNLLIARMKARDIEVVTPPLSREARATGQRLARWRAAGGKIAAQEYADLMGSLRAATDPIFHMIFGGKGLTSKLSSRPVDRQAWQAWQHAKESQRIRDQQSRNAQRPLQGPSPCGISPAAAPRWP
jgi:hypothetical protein